MKKNNKTIILYLLLISSLTTRSVSANETKEPIFTLEEIVVTAPTVISPLTVVTNPKAPRQPVPAADGGGYLKNIPGFSVVRKGGTAGDPVFRGLGGTRLNILLDGTNLLGGCPGRMDPTTSYVFPESYDKIIINKGPNSVQYGGGNIAGSVQFERYTPRFKQASLSLNTSFLYGSFGRNDEYLDLTAGDSDGFIRIIRTRSDSNNYKDGLGQKIHSFYTRNSLTTLLGWTPSEDTRIEFTYDISKAQAAYADRNMDGSKFDKASYNLKYERKNLSPTIKKLTFQGYRNYIDHVMDNYSLRPQNMMPMSMNVDRTTIGGKTTIDLLLNNKTSLAVGFDYRKDKHTGNMVSGTNYRAKAKERDMTFENLGLFLDFTHQSNDNNRLLYGLRFDQLDVTYAKYPNRKDNNLTYGAFMRYEHDYANKGLTSYIGIGHAERPADWWERKKNGWENLSPEKNTQLDVGILHKTAKTQASLSAFYSKINDFILITNAGSDVQNINAQLYGSELELTHKLNANWTASATLALIHGTNKTQERPLAQIPPIEGSIGLRYTENKFGAGILWRGVQAQNRVDIGSGSEIGTDIGPSSGFGILSANLSYRANKNVLLAFGIDNLFNKNYAEFISRTGAAIDSLGITQSLRVNEPGRTAWVKLNYNY